MLGHESRRAYGVPPISKVPRDRIALFTHNSAIPLSLQVAVVEHLGRFGAIAGRGDVIAILCGASTESHARFLATSLRMLADYPEKQTPLTAVAAHGPLIGRDRAGALILPAPVDYLSWAERIATFAQNPDIERTAGKRAETTESL